jgi:hypothetical protein
MTPPKLDPQWRDLLRERSGSAILMALDSIVQRHGVTVVAIDGWENIAGFEQRWIIHWRSAKWTPGPRGMVAPIETHVAVVQFEGSAEVSHMALFYRRAEKRLKLFAELVRD